MIDGQSFFHQPVKNNWITFDNIQKIAIGQGHDYTTACLSDYNYFNNYNKMIATDLSKPQAHNADPIAMQQISQQMYIEMETQQCFSILKKRKKPF